MKYKQMVVLFAIFFLCNQTAYGKAKTATGPPTDKNTIDEPGLQVPKGPSNWSHFFQLFKLRNLGESTVQFETGLSVYAVTYDTWKFRRFEPFVKLRWSLLGKYLSLYTIFSTDFTTVDYELSHFQMGTTDVSFTANMKTSGKHAFGGGIQLLIFGYKKFNMFGYAQTQSTSISSATLEGAILSINGTQYDLFEKIQKFVDITYTFERYDCGAIFSYQFLKWFTLWASVGYIWLNADIKLLLKPELADVIRVALGTYDNDIVPDRLFINQASPFGMMGVKFKLFRRFHLNIEGTVLPAENPVYYGQISLSIE